MTKNAIVIEIVTVIKIESGATIETKAKNERIGKETVTMIEKNENKIANVNGNEIEIEIEIETATGKPLLTAMVTTGSGTEIAIAIVITRGGDPTTSLPAPLKA